MLTLEENQHGSKPKENRESHEKTFQYKSRNESLLEDDLIEDKLTQLLAFVDELKHTPEGTAQLQRRAKLFGECNRDDGDNSAAFYAKLHHWLERDIAHTKVAAPSPETD